MAGPGGGYFRGLDRMWRLGKVWREQTEAVKARALRERISHLRQELRRMKDDPPSARSG